MAHLTKGKGPSDYVLTGIKGKHLTDTMSKAFRRLSEVLGFTAKREKTLHSIRNTVITALEHAGVPEGTVQDKAGDRRHQRGLRSERSLLQNRSFCNRLGGLSRAAG